MLLFSIAILIGLFVLVWSADKFVIGAVASALRLGMTPMMVGLTIVAFGTSAPELIVSATAALSDASHLAIGNAIGSNIANIALVLGATTLISAIPVKKSALKLELPVLVVATLIASFLIYDGSLTFVDGIGLLATLFIALFILAKFQDNNPGEIEDIDVIKSLTPLKAYTLLFFSIILLIASSKLLVWGAVGIATDLGVSKLVIGLTIVAIGTSLPELAAAIASAKQGHHDLALGNIIGSNLFNLLAVLAIPAFLATKADNFIEIEDIVLYRDYALMLILTLGLAFFAFFKNIIGKSFLGKSFGLVLLIIYFSYLITLYFQSATV